jgi:hypothetical protein
VASPPLELQQGQAVLAHANRTCLLLSDRHDWLHKYQQQHMCVLCFLLDSLQSEIMPCVLSQCEKATILSSLCAAAAAAAAVCGGYVQGLNYALNKAKGN